MTYILYNVKTDEQTLFSLDDFEKFKKTDEWSEIEIEVKKKGRPTKAEAEAKAEAE